MATVDGAWDCVTQTPMGEQKSVFTVKSDGARFTGVNAGEMGSLDVIDGRVDGNRLSWKMDMTRPIPMTLDASALIEGDRLTGEVRLGGFGVAPMTGTRRG